MGLIFDHYLGRNYYIGSSLCFWCLEVKFRNEDPRNKGVIEDFIKNREKDGDKVFSVTGKYGISTDCILYSTTGKPKQIKNLVRKLKEINGRVDYMFIDLRTDTYLKHGSSIYYDRVHVRDRMVSFLYKHDKARKGFTVRIEDEKLR